MANVREFLRRSDAIVGTYLDLKKILLIAKLGDRSKRIRHYLRTNSPRKLQLGAGSSSLPGWLCTDLAPSSDAVVFLDATKPFPFESGVLDYIFSEHFIEHISWHAGKFMLMECHRVLKPGGIVRIATPDLAVLLDLYASTGSRGKEQYIKWITDSFLPGVSVYKPQFVINNAFRNWGHQFLYDGELLELALREAGFKDITRCQYGESLHEHLRGIESHGKNVGSAEMAIYETMVYEAKRPE